MENKLQHPFLSTLAPYVLVLAFLGACYYGLLALEPSQLDRPLSYEYAATDSRGEVWGVTHRLGDDPKGCKGDISAYPHALRLSYLSPQLVDAFRRCDGALAPAGAKK